MGFLVTPGTEVHNNVICTAAAASCSLLGSMWMLGTYRTYHAILHSAFNDIAATVAVLQGLQALERLIVSVTALASSNVPFLLCDIGGSIDQSFGVAAEVLLASFCCYLAVPHVRMRGVRWNVAYIASLLVAVVSVTCCWVFLHDGAHVMAPSLAQSVPADCHDYLPFPAVTAGSDVTDMHFTLELGWCWLPSDACWFAGFTQTQLDALRAGCAYTTAVAYIVAAISALVSLSCSNSNMSCLTSYNADGDNYSSSNRVPRVVFARLFLMAVFPAIALGFGAASRFSGDDHRRLDSVSAVLLPLCGFWNALVFLSTEQMTLSLCQRLPCSVRCGGGRGGDGEDGEYSDVGSPTLTLPNGFSPPNGFTAAIRFLSCDLAVGEARREQRQVFVDVDTLLLRGSADILPMESSSHTWGHRSGGDSTRRVLEM